MISSAYILFIIKTLLITIKEGYPREGGGKTGDRGRVKQNLDFFS